MKELEIKINRAIFTNGPIYKSFTFYIKYLSMVNFVSYIKLIFLKIILLGVSN